MASLREVENAAAAFLVEYVAVIVVSEILVEVDLASDTDDLAAGVTAAVVAIAAFVDVVIVAGYVVLFVVVAADDAGVPAAAYFDANI